MYQWEQTGKLPGANAWGWILPSKLLLASKGEKNPQQAVRYPGDGVFQENIEKQECTQVARKGPTPLVFKSLMGFQLSCTCSSTLSTSLLKPWTALAALQYSGVCMAAKWRRVFFFPFWWALETHKLKKIKLLLHFKSSKTYEALSVSPLPYGIYMQFPSCAKSISLHRWIER